MPTRCPLASSAECPICHVEVDHYRKRKTGPRFPIAVLFCSTHHFGFTFYPSGHVPYGRDRVAPVSPDGERVSPAALRAASVNSDDSARAWAQTRFSAVMDATSGVTWPRDEPGARFATQQTRLSEASALFTLQGGPTGVDEEVSRRLGMPQLSLREVAEALGRTSDGQDQGKQLLALLKHAATTPRVLEVVLALGARAGLWGTVHFWVRGAHGATPSRVLFPGVGMPPGEAGAG